MVASASEKPEMVKITFLRTCLKERKMFDEVAQKIEDSKSSDAMKSAQIIQKTDALLSSPATFYEAGKTYLVPVEEAREFVEKKFTVSNDKVFGGFDLKNIHDPYMISALKPLQIARAKYA